MSLVQRIDDEIKAAMRARDAARLGVLRMLKSRLTEREVQMRAGGERRPLTDDQAIEVIAAYAKQRRDSIDGYRAGGREEQARAEEAELALVQEFLPAQISEDEVRDVVRAAVAETGATSMRDIGAVMKLVMPRLKGVADGKLVNRIVREALGG